MSDNNSLGAVIVTSALAGGVVIYAAVRCIYQKFKRTGTLDVTKTTIIQDNGGTRTEVIEIKGQDTSHDERQSVDLNLGIHIIGKNQTTAVSQPKLPETEAAEVRPLISPQQGPMDGLAKAAEGILTASRTPLQTSPSSPTVYDGVINLLSQTIDSLRKLASQAHTEYKTTDVIAHMGTDHTSNTIYVEMHEDQPNTILGSTETVCEHL